MRFCSYNLVFKLRIVLGNRNIHTPIKQCQMKDDKERNYFSLRIIFWKCLFPMLKYFWKVHQKGEPFNGKKYTKSYTLNCSHNCPYTFPHSYASLGRLVFEKKKFNYCDKCTKNLAALLRFFFCNTYLTYFSDTMLLSTVLKRVRFILSLFLVFLNTE